MTALLEVRGVVGYFDTYEGRVHALNGVDLPIEGGRVTGLVGETGSGKSATVSLMLGIPAPNFRLVRGEILFDGMDILKLSDKQMRQLRGKRISISFQDPRGALNPVVTAGEQLARVARQHLGLSWRDARRAAVEMLERVQISEPARRAGQYPHELSGGMAQRVMIAMAMIPSPELLILDEPTTGLDVTVQAEILDLLRTMMRESGLTALVISHDLSMVSEICELVAVMYSGWIVEYGTVRQVFEEPSHPYTQELVRSALRVEETPDVEGDRMSGHVAPGIGCLFMSRCPIQEPRCAEEPPSIVVDSGHRAKCHFATRLRDDLRAAARAAGRP